MQEEKHIAKYYFSTEGETELWYLEHLAHLINAESSATRKVSFSVKKDSPRGFIKRLAIIKATEVFHLFDVESTECEYEKRFTAVLDNMKAAEKTGKSVTYVPAYTNLTFELWMILHKMDCNASVGDRKNYLAHINKAYGVHYAGLKTYKEEAHFKRILAQISLDDVKHAVNRAERIMQENRLRGYKANKRHTYSWYSENPATKVGAVVKQILLDCGIHV